MTDLFKADFQKIKADFFRDNRPWIKTNMGNMPVEDYLDIYSMQHGFEDYDDLCNSGYKVPGYENVTIEVFKKLFEPYSTRDEEELSM